MISHAKKIYILFDSIVNICENKVYMILQKENVKRLFIFLKIFDEINKKQNIPVVELESNL